VAHEREHVYLILAAAERSIEDVELRGRKPRAAPWLHFAFSCFSNVLLKWS
jgi:hypothetical protein